MLMRTRKGKIEKKGRKAVKRAEKASKKAAKRAEHAGREAQERAAEYAERAGEVAAETASELADKLRKSEGIAKAQAVTSEYAGKAKQRWDDSELEDRLTEVGHRLRESDVAKKAEKKGKDVSEASIAALGEWLTSSKKGKKVSNRLGVQKKSRWRTVLATGIGVAAGFAIARLVQPQPAGDLADEFAASADELASAPPVGTALVDAIRGALSDNPATASLDDLTINVAEGTVFVRGTVPEGTDEDAIREVIGKVPGVTDVDLQLTTGAQQQ
jgi:hypothetical protein